MSYKQRVIKTLRVRNQQQIGVLDKVIHAIASHGGDLGDIKTLSVGTFHSVRDITVICNDDGTLQEIVKALKDVKETHLEAVIDDVMELHRGGKIQVLPRNPVKSIEDLRKVYTPGVASISKLIHADPEQAIEFTGIGRTVALVTNGSRVLGLGNIGPVASMPVMEGKSALFSQFSGMNMVPILCDTLDPKVLIETVCTISKGYAAIQLEDIRAPDCFEIEDELIKRLSMPVMHDDQHGTAVVSLAAAINACRIAGIDFKHVQVGQIGLGAAGSAIARLIMHFTNHQVMGTDVQKIAVERFKELGGDVVSSVQEMMKKADVIVATTGQSGLIKPEWVRKGQIILALSNPYPEISIPDALKAGASFASDGSRVNNLLGYPGILKGAINARATSISREMYIAAAEAIVRHTPERELVPDPLDPTLHERVATSVEEAAYRSGVAVRKDTLEAL
ncbi:MAG: NAD-dependent malic enzyme [Deltaproteobacteria bacterium]|nr:MAG: NAD-dependent malic enzyme [Deltaproteobacteria bacterium]